MVVIEWIESVRSERYQAPKTAARITANSGVVVVSGKPAELTSWSVIWVPRTEITTTAAQ